MINVFYDCFDVCQKSIISNLTLKREIASQFCQLFKQNKLLEYTVFSLHYKPANIPDQN